MTRKKNAEVAVPEVVVKIAELANALDVADIKDLPGCWEYQVDEQWWFAINGGTEPRATSRRGEGKVDPIELEPFNLLVEFNGWPAGLLNMHGGSFAVGTAANEGTFIEALQRKIDEVTKAKGGQTNGNPR